MPFKALVPEVIYREDTERRKERGGEKGKGEKTRGLGPGIEVSQRLVEVQEPSKETEKNAGSREGLLCCGLCLLCRMGH